MGILILGFDGYAKSVIDTMLETKQYGEILILDNRDKVGEMFGEAKAQEGFSREWMENIIEYANITELDNMTLNRLIKEIVVHEEIDVENNRNISIEIHFNFKPIPEVSDTGIPAGAASGH